MLDEIEKLGLLEIELMSDAEILSADEESYQTI
jgi:hypothetical protein